jgi:hypothetical protein
MMRSALALGSVSARPRALRRAIGELIAGRVQATARVAGAKTNLRIVLLFATLAARRWRVKRARRVAPPSRGSWGGSTSAMQPRRLARSPWRSREGSARRPRTTYGHQPVSPRERRWRLPRTATASRPNTPLVTRSCSNAACLAERRARPRALDPRRDRRSARWPAVRSAGHPDRGQGAHALERFGPISFEARTGGARGLGVPPAGVLSARRYAAAKLARFADRAVRAPGGSSGSLA